MFYEWSRKSFNIQWSRYSDVMNKHSSHSILSTQMTTFIWSASQIFGSDRSSRSHSSSITKCYQGLLIFIYLSQVSFRSFSGISKVSLRSGSAILAQSVGQTMHRILGLGLTQIWDAACLSGVQWPADPVIPVSMSVTMESIIVLGKNLVSVVSWQSEQNNAVCFKNYCFVFYIKPICVSTHSMI